MDTKLHIVAGPPTNQVTRDKAEEALRAHPNFPKNASVTIDEVEGRWVAAIYAAEDLTKESAPPFGAGEGGPPAAAPEAPAAPVEEGPPTDELTEEPKEEGEKKPEEGKEKGEKGVEHQIHALTEMVHTLMEALGIAPAPDASMVPGAEGAPPGAPGMPPPGATPAGADTNPQVPGAQGRDNKTHTVHERALKPGEAQPGSTPVGAPAFASVGDEHPWKEVIGKVRTFTATEELAEEESLASVEQEINALAEGTGYEIKQLREGREDGKRVARVLLSR